MKKAYEILDILFKDQAMPDIVRYKSELDALGDKNDYYDIIFSEAFNSSDIISPDTLRYIKNAIILSCKLCYGPFDTIHDENEQKNAVILFHYCSDFFISNIDIIVHKNHLLYYSNEFLSEYCNSGIAFSNDNFELSDINKIVNLHGCVLDFYNRDKTEKLLFPWSLRQAELRFVDEWFFQNSYFFENFIFPITYFGMSLSNLLEKEKNINFKNKKLLEETIFYFEKIKSYFDQIEVDEFLEKYNTEFSYEGSKLKLEFKDKVPFELFLNSIISTLSNIDLYEPFQNNSQKNEFLKKLIIECFK